MADQTISISLDGSRRRDLKLFAGDDVRFLLAVYPTDPVANETPITVLTPTFNVSPSGLFGIPMETVFTVPGNYPGRFWYSIKGEISGSTTTICYGVLDVFSADVARSGDDYGWPFGSWSYLP